MSNTKIDWKNSLQYKSKFKKMCDQQILCTILNRLIIIDLKYRLYYIQIEILNY